MKVKDLTVETFPFYFSNPRQNAYDLQDVIGLIKAGNPIRLAEMEKSFIADWKGLEIHTQKLYVYDYENEIMIELERKVSIPPQNAPIGSRRRIFAMAGSDCE